MEDQESYVRGDFDKASLNAGIIVLGPTIRLSRDIVFPGQTASAIRGNLTRTRQSTAEHATS